MALVDSNEVKLEKLGADEQVARLTDEVVRKMTAQNLRTLWDRKSKKLDLTQEKAAEMLGISASAVSYILSGRSQLGLTHAHNFARLLDVGVDEIVQLDGDQSAAGDALKGGEKFTRSELKRAIQIIGNLYGDLGSELTVDYALDALGRVKRLNPTDKEITTAVQQVVTEQLKKKT